MKKTFLNLILISLLCNTSFGQFYVGTNGAVVLNSTLTNQWGSAFKIKVNCTNACAFNLWSAKFWTGKYFGADVFYAHSSGFFYTALGGFQRSDSNSKENIKTIDSAISKIQQLNGVEYTYKAILAKDSLGNTTYLENPDSNRIRLGVLAQDVENVYPGLVRVMQDSTKAVSYNDLIGLLIEGIKEQQIQINELKESITECCNNAVPVLTTFLIYDISVNSATTGGDISSDGGATISSRGVCWSTSQPPTLSDNITSNGTGKGSFTSNITGFLPNTTYYVRAYATSSNGKTGYGNVVSFSYSSQ